MLLFIFHELLAIYTINDTIELPISKNDKILMPQKINIKSFLTINNDIPHFSGIMNEFNNNIFGFYTDLIKEFEKIFQLNCNSLIFQIKLSTFNTKKFIQKNFDMYVSLNRTLKVLSRDLFYLVFTNYKERLIIATDNIKSQKYTDLENILLNEKENLINILFYQKNKLIILNFMTSFQIFIDTIVTKAKVKFNKILDIFDYNRNDFISGKNYDAFEYEKLVFYRFLRQSQDELLNKFYFDLQSNLETMKQAFDSRFNHIIHYYFKVLNYMLILV